MDRERTDQGRLLTLEAALAVAALLVSRVMTARGLPVYDDAFITFRQARNLAEHGELAYHLGDPALVSSSPGFVAICALIGAFGLDIPAGARVVGALAEAFGVVVLGRTVGGGRVGAVALLALICARSPLLSMAAVGGLETWPFVVAVVLACREAAGGRPVRAGLAAGMAGLLRPEGLVLCALVVLFGRFERRGRLQAGGAAVGALAAVAAVVLALGASPIPRSLTAKWGLAGGGLGETVAGLLLGDASLLLVLPLSAVGIYLVTRDEDRGDRVAVGLILGWAGAVAVAYAVVRPQVWEWYGVPLILPLLGLAGLAGGEAVERLRERWRWVVVLPLAAVVVLPPLAWSIRSSRDGPSPITARIHDEMARWSAQVEPGDKVVAWDVGAVGWFWSEAEIVDLNGLASRAGGGGLGEAGEMAAAEARWMLVNVTRHGFRVLDEAGVAAEYRGVARLSPAGSTDTDVRQEGLPAGWAADYVLFERRGR